jgi:hypothetical protein
MDAKQQINMDEEVFIKHLWMRGFQVSSYQFRGSFNYHIELGVNNDVSSALKLLDEYIFAIQSFPIWPRYATVTMENDSTIIINISNFAL